MKQRIAKAPKIRRPLGGGGHLAFGGGGGAHAFRDPATMVAPDQAFTAAMGKGSAAPASPAASPGPGSPAAAG